MGVNISAKFTKNDELYNGLHAIIDDLLADPTANRTAVVTYRVKFDKADWDNGGAKTPTIKLVEFEPLVEEAAAEQAKTLQREAFKARTGNPMQEDLFSSQASDDEGWDDEGDKG